MLYTPEIAVWEFTFMCNVNCIHCGSDCGETTRPDELNTEEAIHLVEQLAELGCKLVTISGGEPFVRKDWPIIAHKVRQLGMDLAFISNGYIINPEIVALLVKLTPKVVGISLDGGEAAVHDYIRGRKNSFERALNALNMLLDAGLYTSVVTTLQRINFHELEKIKQIILLYGVDAWQIQTATPQGRMDRSTSITERQFYEAAKFIVKNNNRYKKTYFTGADCVGYYGTLHQYLHPYDWNGCHAGIKAIGIESNGNIKGCLSLPGDDFIEGNIREKPLAEIWNNPNAFKFNRHFKLELLGGYCKECFYGPVCRGGCTERSYGYTKTFCENTLCLHKFEQKGFSSEIEASLHPEPEKTDELYDKISPLPDKIRLANLQIPCQ